MPAPSPPPRPSTSAPHRHAFASPSSPLTPLYTHLSPSVSIQPYAVLLPSDSSAYFLQPPGSPRLLPPPLESDRLTAVALTRDASYAILAHRSAQVSIHSLPIDDPPAPPRTFRPFQSTNLVSLIAVHPSSHYAALAAADGAIRVHNVANHTLTHILTCPVPLTTLVFPPDPNTTHLFAGCDDGSIHIFDLSSKSSKPKHVLSPHVARVTSIIFPPKSSVVVTTSLDSVLATHAYSPSAKTPVSPSATLTATTHPIVAAAALPDGRIVTASPLPTLRVWNVAKRCESTTIQLRLPFVRSSVAENDDDDKSNHEEDVSTTDEVTVAYMCPTSTGLLVALTDQTLLFADGPAASALRISSQIICGNLEEVYDVCFLPSVNDGGALEGKDRCVVVASNSAVVWVVQPSSANYPQWKCRAALHAHTGNVLSLDAVAATSSSSPSLFVASASRDRTARVWRQCTRSGKWTYMAVAEGHADAVTAVAVAPRVIAGQFYMVTASADRTLKRWSLDGVRKAAGSDEMVDVGDVNGCDVVDVRDGKDSEGALCLSASWTALAHSKDVNAVAISPDGAMIATGSQDRSVKVWSAEKGKLVLTCSGHRRGVWSVAFSTVDRILVSASGDATVRVWSVQNGQCLRTLEGHLGGVLRAKFLSRGTQIASCGADGLVKVWSTRTGECDTTLDGHEDRIWGLDVEGDGDVMVSGGADGKVAVWEDCSVAVDDEEAKRKEEEAMMAQVVDSAARACEWSVAARGALKLGMTQKMKGIVSEVVTKSVNAEEELLKMVRGVFAVGDEDEEVREKRWEWVERLLLWCRDWNASGGAKSAAISSYVLQAVFSVWTAGELCDKLRTERRALVEALAAHCQRHMERVNELGTKVALLEYTLKSMGSVGSAAATLVGKDTRVEKVGDNAIATPQKPRLKRRRREEVDCEY